MDTNMETAGPANPLGPGGDGGGIGGIRGHAQSQVQCSKNAKCTFEDKHKG